jgi:hypothetical protein
MTSHQLARELLALPNGKIWHHDPSFADSATSEEDHTVAEPVVEPHLVQNDLQRYYLIKGDRPEWAVDRAKIQDPQAS